MALGSDTFISELISAVHDHKVGVEYGEQLLRTVKEFEGDVGLAREHVANTGVTEINFFSQLLDGDPVVVEHLLQPVGEALFNASCLGVRLHPWYSYE
jgi:hypothetical protein